MKTKIRKQYIKKFYAKLKQFVMRFALRNLEAWTDLCLPPSLMRLGNLTHGCTNFFK